MRCHHFFRPERPTLPGLHSLGAWVQTLSIYKIFTHALMLAVGAGIQPDRGGDVI